MFRHMLKLAWKRKTRNVMLTLEILIAFLVVFAIACFAVRNFQLYSMPVGIDPERVWSVKINTPQEVKLDHAFFDSTRRTLKGMAEIEEVAYTTFPPFTHSSWSGDVTEPGSKRKLSTNMLTISDEFPAVTGMKLVEGRWFSDADAGGTAVPVILNRRLAQALFPGQSAVGKQFQGDDKEGPPRLVTGIVAEFRSQGEFMTPVNFMIERATGTGEGQMHTIMLKVRAGTTRDFEAKLMRQLQQVRGDVSYEVSTLDELRASSRRSTLIPLVILSVVAAFLLLMVAFGLFGVLWQNTTRRIPEIGLRRALGADAGQIYRQIIAEQMLLSTIAMLLALVLLVQLPITGALGESMNWAVFLAAAALSMGVIYLISLLCSLYPGWRASRLSPTEALHYE
jgi:putative ABC transport system permease protein